ncbi:unnamed protein product [Pleuronectes platessa]|uniref:Uncharacterized protein n=1 Tax=Pleuronectes platessa TaxID=8262 RepID=A0A9N7TWA8_PLEPL|nr:unnamed protein product [Pleuronectes platessa]
MATLTLSDRLTGVEKCGSGLTGLNRQAGACLRIAVRGAAPTCGRRRGAEVFGERAGDERSYEGREKRRRRKGGWVEIGFNSEEEEEEEEESLTVSLKKRMRLTVNQLRKKFICSQPQDQAVRSRSTRPANIGAVCHIDVVPLVAEILQEISGS